MITNTTNRNTQEPTRSHQVATLKRQLASDLKNNQFESFDRRLLEFSYIASDDQWNKAMDYLESLVDSIE